MIIDELIAILGYDVQGEDDLKRFNNGLKEAEQNARALAERIGKGVAIAGAAMAAGLAFLGKGVIDTGAKFENLGVRLEALEGSAAKGQQALEWVRKFAEETPLSLSEAAEAYARLRTFGIDPTNGSLMAAVDTMAMAGQGADYLSGVVLAMGQAWTKGKLQGEEALQLIERNVPVWDMLSEAMGISAEKVQELSQKGKLGRKEMQLLFDAMGKRSQGASAKMAKTWTGLMGRLGDKWEGFLKIIADGGFFDEAKRALEGFVDDIDSSFTDGRAAHAAKALGDILRGVLSAMRTLAGQTANHIRYIIDNFDTLKPYIYGIAAAFGVLAAATFPVWSAFLGLGIVIDDFLTYLEGGKSVFGDVVQWLRDMVGLPEKIAEAFTGVGALIVSTLGIGVISLLPGLVAKISLAFAGLFASAIGAVTGPVIGAIAGIFALLATPAGWAVILVGIGAALVAYFYDDIVAAAPKMVAAGKAMGQAILDGIKSIGGAIADWFASQIPDWAKGMFGGGNGPARPKDSEAPPAPSAPSSPSRGAYPVAPSPSAPQTPAPGRGRYKIGAPSPMDNFNANLAKMSAPNAVASVVTDNSQDNRQYPVTVNAPVTQNITQATQAPAAAAAGIAGAIKQGVQAVPSRMQSGLSPQ